MREVFVTGFAVMVCAHAAHCAPSAGFSFTTLGDLPGGSFFSVANGVSRDGTTIVGQSGSADGSEGYVWRAGVGMIPLGDLAGGSFASSGRALSADGSVVIGNSQTSNGTRAFRWTLETGMISLGSIPPTDGFSNPWGISGDGRYISGTAQAPTGFDGFIYDSSSGVMSSIGAFEGRAISDDGAVVSGIENTPGGPSVATRWTQATGHVELGLLRVTDSLSDPVAMTPDGSTIVGWSAPTPDGFPENQRAFVWTEDDGMVGLPSVFGTPANWINQATGISADGSVIVGFERVPGDNEQFAVLWDGDRGAIDLQALLESRGVSFEGYELISATGVSGDGRTIVGTARDPGGFLEAYIVTIPAPPIPIVVAPVACAFGCRRRR